MEYANIILNVCIVWAIAVLSPGPNFFISAQTAVAVSRRTALHVVLGIGTGTMLWGVCGYFGLTLLFKIAPWFYIVLKVLGGGYLVYLGLMLLFARRKGNGLSRTPLQSRTRFAAAYRLGLLTNLSNPKAVVFTTSLFAATLPPDPPLLLGLTTICIMASFSTSWYAAVAVMFSSDRMTQAYARLRRWVDCFSGLIFIGFGLKFAAAGR